MAVAYLATPCPSKSPCRADPRSGRERIAHHPDPAPQLDTPQRFTNPGSGWTFTGTTMPRRYVIGWPDGVVKIGSTLTGNGERIRSLLNKGGTLLHLAHYALDDVDRAELWLQREADARWLIAFSCRHEATAHLGPQGGGWTECYRVPDDELTDLLALAVM